MSKVIQLYKYKDIRWKKTYYYYQTSCPSNTGAYTYSCTELLGTVNSASINAIPNNFICFGTSDLTECKANEEKYLYRIIGVFPDESEEQHLKLIKYKQLGPYYWHNTYEPGIFWEESDLYKGLNGISGGKYSNLFIGNTTYDYLQDNKWLNKIVDWKWTATNTLYSNDGPNYPSLTTEQMYLHEMNRSAKPSTVGTWTYPVAKIGLMYASDYQMSLGSSSLTMTGSSNYSTLKTGWLHQSNNDTSKSTDEWTLSLIGIRSYNVEAWVVNSEGRLNNNYVYNTYGLRPVFYMTSNTTVSLGSGEYSDPYILE